MKGVVADHLRALVGETLRNTTPDVRAGARDQRYFASQFHASTPFEAVSYQQSAVSQRQKASRHRGVVFS